MPVLFFMLFKEKKKRLMWAQSPRLSVERKLDCQSAEVTKIR